MFYVLACYKNGATIMVDAPTDAMRRDYELTLLSNDSVSYVQTGIKATDTVLSAFKMIATEGDLASLEGSNHGER